MIFLGVKRKLENNNNDVNKEFEQQLKLALEESLKDNFILSKEEKQIKIAIELSKKENKIPSNYIEIKEEGENKEIKNEDNEKEKEEEEDEEIKQIKYAKKLSFEEYNIQLLLEKEEKRQLELAIKTSMNEISNNLKNNNNEIEEFINNASIIIDEKKNGDKRLKTKEYSPKRNNIINNNNIINQPDDKKFKNMELKKKEEFDENFGICPITQDYMKNPVLTPSGHYYEKTAILDWLKKHDTDPMTREHLDINMLIEDKDYKKLIRKYRKKYNK